VSQTMRAVVLQGPGPAEALELTEVPVPHVGGGSVLIRVRAFGLNRSELHLRQGVAGNATFPRIPGIEATGVVVRITESGCGAMVSTTSDNCPQLSTQNKRVGGSSPSRRTISAGHRPAK